MERNVVVEEAKKRCRVVCDEIQALSLSNITDSCKRTLLRLVNSELKFLTRTSSSSSSNSNSNSNSIISINVGYIECILHILQQPFITGVSRVCKPVPFPSSVNKHDSPSKAVYVDIICTLNRIPVWFIVSDRNPNYITWSPQSHNNNKGLRLRIHRVLEAARSSLMLKPASVFLFFANGLDGDVSHKLIHQFGAILFGNNDHCFPKSVYFSEELEDGWINVTARSYVKAQLFQIVVDSVEDSVPKLGISVGDSHVEDARSKLYSDQMNHILGHKFSSLLSKMRLHHVKAEALFGKDILNFDTTALIALVSGISNGGTEKLLATPESELRKRFKSNYEFVISQVRSELQNPILEELTCVVSGKVCMICESVHLEFKELVSMCGGSKEKLRADQLLKCLLIVPDSPSARMMDILTTRKIASKNKVVFGTGDQWLAPTLTANMGFVRAISQTGMSLLTLEHKPRALTGDYE